NYTLAIPAAESGMRKFCLWALGMAILTLRKINSNPYFRNGAQVKISRNSVKLTVATTSLIAGYDGALRALFRAASLGIPRATVTANGPTFIDGMDKLHSR
ncbi:MAG: hypothetical protein ACREXT_18390, partial [Gammaproteobacteria bacterium]